MIAVTLTPSCYCSEESWWRRAWVGSSWYPALLLILLNRENRTCSFLLRSGEMLSSEPPLVLKHPMLGERCWKAAGCLWHHPPLLLLSSCFGVVTWAAADCQSSLRWSAKNLIHYSSGFFHCSSNIRQFPANMVVSHLSAVCMNHGGLSSKFVKQWLSPRTDTTVYNCRKAFVWQTSRRAIPGVHGI